MDNDEAENRRKKLKQMRDELPDIPPSAEEMQGTEMLSYVKTLKEQKDKRSKQFSIVKDLFEDPLTFDLDKQVIPTSSSREEIIDRKKELQYRIDMLRSILEIADAEMQILVQALRTKPEDNPENPAD